jgi:hypothetical protein
VGSFCIRPVCMGCTPCAFNNIDFLPIKKNLWETIWDWVNLLAKLYNMTLHRDVPAYVEGENNFFLFKC